MNHLELEVIELDTSTIRRTAGMKGLREFRALHGRAPRRTDLFDDQFWRFSLG